MKFKLEERFILTEADTFDPRDTLIDSPEEQQIEQDSDWEELYYNCKNQEDFANFWDKYLEATFNKNASKAKSFLPALASFFSKIKNKDLGWTVQDNPIIALLSGINEGDLSPISLAHLNNSSVYEVATAYLKNILTTELISATLKAKDKKYLLACPEFYSLTATDQEQYLKLQKTIEQNKKSFFDLCIDSNTNKLVPIKQAKINLKKAGINTSTPQELGTNDINTQYLKNLGINKANAGEAFACLYDILRVVSPGSIKLAAKQCSNLKSLRKQTSTLTLSQIENWYPKLMPAKTAYKQEAGAKLLLAIAEYAGAEIKDTRGYI